MHQTTVHVRWGELDPYHHVNHASYLGYLEHARIEALESIGWGMGRIAEHGCRVVVVRADVQFRASASGGDLLTVSTSIEELRGASSRWRQQIHRGEDLILDAEITAACTNLDGRPTRTPQAFQRALADLAAVTT